jgi:hypothetical protein
VNYPESFARWLSRTQIREREPWHRIETDAAHERISRNGEADGPGKTVGTSAIVPCPRVPVYERERIIRLIVAHPGLRFAPEHPSEKLTLAQAKALARAGVKSYT